MSSATRKNTKKKSLGIALLVACLLLVAIGGTIAWLTAQSELTNRFTVGKINPIDPDEPGPDPDEPIDPDPTKLNANLYEPNWEDGSQLTPDATIPKDPYVGVGAGSEKAYVYVYVTNSMVNNEHVYFTINEGWEPVTDCVETVTGDTTKYISGLFKYTAGLDGTTATATENIWTSNPLFTNVIVSDEAEDVDFQDKDDEAAVGSIKVQSYLHQYADGKGAQIAEDTVVLPAVKDAFGIN